MKKTLLSLCILLACLITYAQEVPVLVKDIIPGSKSGFGNYLYKDFKVFVTTEEAFYFYINDTDGISFWRSDGSSQGTLPLVKFPRNAALDSVILSLETSIRAAAIGNTVYFVGWDETHGVELWETDGTGAGTKLAMDIVPGTHGSNPSYLSNFGGKLLFLAYEYDEEINRYSYIRINDITAQSSTRIMKLFPYDSYMGNFFTLSSKYAFFSYSNIETGTEIWRTDGTTAGTFLLKDIYTGRTGSDPYKLNVIKDLFYFNAHNVENGREHWVSDGTVEGTQLLKDLAPGSISSNPSAFTQAGGKRFFTASAPDGSSYNNLYVTDGTTEGTLHLGDQNVGSRIDFQHKLFFTNWKTNKIKTTFGAPEDIQLLAELPGNDPEFILSTDTVLFFKVFTSTSGNELWRTNGTLEGTFIVDDINPGNASSSPIHAFKHKGEIFFLAHDGIHGHELWKIVHPTKLVSGKVYLDTNKNGSEQADEPGLCNQKLLIMPGNIEVYTNIHGKFNWSGAPGKYTVQVLPTEDWQLSGDSDIYEIIVPGTNQVTFGLTQTTPKPAIDIQLTSSAPSRCGFEVVYWLDYVNKGNVLVNGEILLDINPEIILIESTPAPVINDNGKLRWNLQNLQPTQQKKILLRLRMPGVDAMGDTLKFRSQANISGTNISARDTLEQVITCAYDPNDKQVKPAGIEEEHYTLKNSWLDYTIRFQNTGTDTAFTVVLRDTLDIGLDLTTLQILGSSHSMQASRKANAMEFMFDNILLPDSTTNEPLSHGYVRYRIKAKAGVAENTVVENKAYIFFDFNPAIVTNTTFNTLVTTLPQREVTGIQEQERKLKVFPNPTEGTINLQAQAPIEEVLVYNQMGQLIHQQVFKNPKPEQNISIAYYPPGIYLVRVRAGKSHFQQKLVKH
ncbi:hypothetical protein D770_05810 [Flammeovirgaceae bacterium 311]|nr:hypothetical protein D770_05810 [Flammeovirgaceae bacterium 311]